ncbi:MAG: hypothetical protein ACJA08_001170 [Cyclobacteriaceae bacterium]|jgi:hypothetical protein
MKYIEQSALFLILLFLFAPLAFLLMPLVAAILVVLAFAMLFGGWKIKHHGMD